MRRLLLLAVPLLFSLSCCLLAELSREEYCEKAWRYDLECALNYTLSEEEVAKVRELAESLRGKDCLDSSWNVLEWVEKNIEYDSWKALLPSPTILIRGKEVIVQNPERFYQTPYETVKLRKGICGDYAILIAALLMNLGCEPFLIRFEFEGENAGHLSAAILLDQYYVLDQNLPPADLGSYYRKWLKEGKRINEGYIYSRGIQVGKLTAEEMREFDHELSESDIRALRDMVRNELRQRMKEDPSIPVGYIEYAKLKITLQNYAELYTPAFSEKFAEMIAKDILENLKKSERDWKAFKVEIERKAADLVVEVELAR